MSEQMSANFTTTAKEFIEAAREEGFSEPVIRKIMRKLRRTSLNYTPFSDFGVSTGIINALKWHDILTVEELKEYVELFGIDALKKIRYIGETRYNELKEKFPWIADCE